MADIKLKSEMGKNYIIITAKEEWQETISAKMLMNNKIDGILPIEFRHIDNKIYYYYPLPYLKSINTYFNTETVNFEILVALFKSIIGILKKSETYFMPGQGFIIDKEWMFWDDVREEVFMCYVPGMQNDNRQDIIEFTEYLMQVTDSKDRSAAKFLYRIYDELSDYGGLCDADGANGERDFGGSYKITINVIDKLDSIVAAFNGMGMFAKVSERKAEQPINTIKTGVTQKNQNKIYALRPCKKELRDDFKMRWGTDYFILEIGEGVGIEITIGRMDECNMALPFSHISRIHATFCYSGGEFYVSDKVSTNGTYVNGKRINANKKTPLKLHDKIAFADISFILMNISATEK